MQKIIAPKQAKASPLYYRQKQSNAPAWLVAKWLEDNDHKLYRIWVRQKVTT